MSKGGSVAKMPKPEDLAAIESRYNRINQSGPYGSSHYSTDANGQTSLTNEMSPEMASVLSRQYQNAATPAERWNMPQGSDQLMSSLMSRVQNRYSQPDPAKSMHYGPMKPPGAG